MQQRSPTNQEKKGRIVTLELDQRGADDAWTTRGSQKRGTKVGSSSANSWPHTLC